LEGNHLSCVDAMHLFRYTHAVLGTTYFTVSGRLGGMRTAKMAWYCLWHLNWAHVQHVW